MPTARPRLVDLALRACVVPDDPIERLEAVGGPPQGTPPADVQRGDARRLKLRAPVAAVITSPPYPSTYDYLPMQQLRAAWLGDDASEADEIGARRHWREGARSARRMWQEDTAGTWELPLDEITLPEMLDQAPVTGSAAAFGTWPLGDVLTPSGRDHPNLQGRGGDHAHQRCA